MARNELRHFWMFAEVDVPIVNLAIDAAGIPLKSLLQLPITPNNFEPEVERGTFYEGFSIPKKVYALEQLLYNYELNATTRFISEDIDDMPYHFAGQLPGYIVEDTFELNADRKDTIQHEFGNFT